MRPFHVTKKILVIEKCFVVIIFEMEVWTVFITEHGSQYSSLRFQGGMAHFTILALSGLQPAYTLPWVRNVFSVVHT